MRILEWFLQFFSAPQPERLSPGKLVKFLEGTEWTCPECGTTLGIARKDIHYGELARSSEWDIKDIGFWEKKHCGTLAMKYAADYRILFHTPTGWVG